ncbi:MAG: hypothetical protein IH941_09400 [Acidobacteria bacterium]|nr:hypothetical protein [Acidobacteriota bacterium]
MMNPQVTTDELASIEMDAESSTRRLRRRRTRTWLAFGLVGLMMGVVWAVGIATSTATVDAGGATAAAQVFNTAPPAAAASQYATLVAESNAVVIDFAGTWGVIAADADMFDVTLSGEAAGTYFLAVFLNNDATGWAALQLEFAQVNKTCATTVPGDWTSPVATSVMVIETADAWAVFPSLAFGNDYCIGIAAATPKANDAAGTYIRRPSGSADPTPPVFVALLGRTA